MNLNKVSKFEKSAKFDFATCVFLFSYASPQIKSPPTNKFFHAKHPMDFFLGGGVKGPDVFKMYVSSIHTCTHTYHF